MSTESIEIRGSAGVSDNSDSGGQKSGGGRQDLGEKKTTTTSPASRSPPFATAPCLEILNRKDFEGHPHPRHGQGRVTRFEVSDADTLASKSKESLQLDMTDNR